MFIELCNHDYILPAGVALLLISLSLGFSTVVLLVQRWIPFYARLTGLAIGLMFSASTAQPSFSLWCHFVCSYGEE